MFSIAYIMTAYANKHNNINDVAWTTAVHLIGIVVILILLPFRLPHGLTKDIGANLLGIMTDPVSLAVAIALGTTMFGSEVCLFNSIKTAPNPGLPTTIGNFYIIVLTILSYIFYGLPISTRQVAGIALALFSLYLIST